MGNGGRQRVPRTLLTLLVRALRRTCVKMYSKKLVRIHILPEYIIQLKSCLKVGTPLTDSEINKIIIALPIWKDVLRGVASQFCKVVSCGPLLIMDTGKFTAWLRSRRQLREILDTELVNAALPGKPDCTNRFFAYHISLQSFLDPLILLILARSVNFDASLITS